MSDGPPAEDEEYCTRASTPGLLLIKDRKEYWKPVLNITTFSRISLAIRSRDESYVIRVEGSDSGTSYFELSLNDIITYVIKNPTWQELTTTDGREMALHLPEDRSLKKFTKVMEMTLKNLGKYDRLQAPGELVTSDEMNQKRTVLSGPPLETPTGPYVPTNRPKTPPPPSGDIVNGTRDIDECEELTADLPAFQSMSSVGPWKCGRCNLNNVAMSFSCVNCQTVRLDAWKCPESSGCNRRLNSVNHATCPDCMAWKCRFCTSVNYQSSAACTMCYIDRPIMQSQN